MRVALFCIAVAATAALGLGALVGLRHDSLIEAQTYLNLVGWGSIGLYGLYYCSPGPVLRPRLAWVQASVATLGVLALNGGLAALNATGDPRLEAVVALGGILAALGAVLFAVQLVPRGRTRGSSPRYA